VWKTPDRDGRDVGVVRTGFPRRVDQSGLIWVTDFIVGN